MSVNPDVLNCCGCTACQNICPRNAITMTEDVLGFKYPQVDPEKCVECSLCDKVCQFKPTYERYQNYDEPIAFQFRIKNVTQLYRSQSGGAFYQLAKHFILTGGVVYGAAFDKKWNVSHCRVESFEDLEKLRMSKYVQSDTQRAFKNVLSDLRNNIKVLFSGTPCQVAGLRKYVNPRFHANLLCVDIVCHGIPSPKIWADNIAYLVAKHQSNLTKVYFRDNKFGWHGATEGYYFANGDTEYRKSCNYLYFSNFSVRDCCSNCPYTNIKRIGDITVGDRWGLPNDSPWEDGKGLSLIFVNSDKGRDLLKSACLGDNVYLEEIPLQLAIQPQLTKPIKLNQSRAQFIRDFVKYDFVYVGKRYGDMGWRFKLKNDIKVLKSIVKKVMVK